MQNLLNFTPSLPKILGTVGATAATAGVLGFGMQWYKNLQEINKKEKKYANELKNLGNIKFQSKDESEEKEDLDLLNMRHYWYPLVCVEEVPDMKPLAIELFGEPLAIYRNPTTKKLNCIADRCPHRGAPLSVGDIDPNTGDLRCLYHGWEFGNDGQATLIPSLAPESGLKKCICVKSYPVFEAIGYVWVFATPNWALAQKAKDSVLQATLKFLYEEEYNNPGKFAILEMGVPKIPFEHGYLVDNLVDYAHVDFTHDGYIGKKEYASEVVLVEGEEIPEYLQKAVPGVQRFNYSQPNSIAASRKAGAIAQMTFIPPCFIKLKNYRKDKGESVQLRQTFLIPPLAPQKCTVQLKFFFGFLPKFVSGMPFLMNWFRKNNITIINQDLEMLLGIQDSVNKRGMKVLGALVKADSSVKGYREWRDKAEKHADPWFKSWSGEKRKNMKFEPKDIEDLLK